MRNPCWSTNAQKMLTRKPNQQSLVDACIPKQKSSLNETWVVTDSHRKVAKNESCDYHTHIPGASGCGLQNTAQKPHVIWQQQQPRNISLVHPYKGLTIGTENFIIRSRTDAGSAEIDVRLSRWWHGYTLENWHTRQRSGQPACSLRFKQWNQQDYFGNLMTLKKELTHKHIHCT